jgi:hypothetical protein
MKPLSKSLQKLMGGWSANTRKTVPRSNRLTSFSAIVLTPQDVRNFLNANKVVLNTTRRNVEHRGNNLAIRNEAMHRYMTAYRKRRMQQKRKKNNNRK